MYVAHVDSVSGMRMQPSDGLFLVDRFRHPCRKP